MNFQGTIVAEIPTLELPATQVGISEGSFKSLVETLKSQLEAAKKAYSKHIDKILSSHAKELAGLSEFQIKKLVDQLENLATSSEIRKAVEYGRGNIPELILKNKALSIKTIARMKRTNPSLLKKLGTPGETIFVKDRSKNIPVPVEKIAKSEALTRKIIDTKKGDYIPPEEQGKKRVFIPDYYKLDSCEPDRNYPECILLVFKQDDSENEQFKRAAQFSRLRVKRSDLPKIIIDIQQAML